MGDLPQAQGHVNIRFADLEKKIEDCKSFSYMAKMKFLVLLTILLSRGDGLMSTWRQTVENV